MPSQTCPLGVSTAGSCSSSRATLLLYPLLPLLKTLLLPLLLVATAAPAAAQTDCAQPALKMLLNGKEIPATGHPMAPSVRLRVAPAPGCPTAVSYRVSSAELTLTRGGRPLLPTRSVRQPRVDLRALMSVAQPGDHIYVFIPYQNLSVVAADGSQQPYLPPGLTKPPPGQIIDLRTDESRGISFSWLLLPQ
jgi:hypothetical protein